MTSEPRKPRLLVIEDDEGLQRQLRWAYEDYEVLSATDRKGAIDLLRLHAPAVVTLDLGLPPDPDGTTEGFATLDAILSLKPDTKVIVASGHGARESALRAVATGAYDYYHKPIDIDELGLIVTRAFDLHGLEQENARLAAIGGATGLMAGFVTADPAMLKVLRTAERVAGADVSVMLLGASGAGKEVLAREIHQASSRAKGHFVAIPLALQVKLLRFLQERVIERVGGRRPIAVDTRILCATHQDLAAMIGEARFREDLYYRLAEIVIRIPPLTERPGDAVLLARRLLQRFAREMNPQVKGFTPDALAAIDGWDWPGNVRELENRIKRAVIMADGKLVTPEDLDLAPGAEDGGFLNLKSAREQADRTAIARALMRAEGNISGAARMLGISRPTLYDLLRQYGIET